MKEIEETTNIPIYGKVGKDIVHSFDVHEFFLVHSLCIRERREKERKRKRKNKKKKEVSE